MNVSNVNGGGHGELAHVAEGAPLRVRNGRAQEGGNARPLISMLCHNELRARSQNLTFSRMLAHLAADRLPEGAGLVNLEAKKDLKSAEENRHHLDIREIHKQTAIIAVV